MSPKTAARRLIRHTELDDLPIDPIAILRSRGVRVIELPFDAMEGLTTRVGAAVVVALGRGRTQSRRRWAAAHELGHVELGHVDHPGVRWDALQGRELCHAANIFAAELLMPRRLIWQAWLRYGSDWDRLARLFGVSVPILRARVDELSRKQLNAFDRTWVSIH